MILVQKAAIKKEDKYLILLRCPENNTFPLYWDFPGGKLKKNENPIDGIKREVREETNLEIEPLGIEGIYEMAVNDSDCRFTIYSTQPSSGDVKLSSEHVACRWADKNEILSLKVEPYLIMYFNDHK
ncbi:MAG: NUDIX hydrolase [Parcubacteria group bacterium]|jgi:8-oxo-dGTP diphosphatase